MSFKHLLFFFLSLLLAGNTQAQTQLTLDRDRLEVIEEQTESLANRLLELSIATRQKDLDQIADFFADSLLAIPLPTEPEDLVHQVKWIYKHGWKIQKEALRLSLSAFLKDWGVFLNHFSEIDDARFKVKKATFDDRGAQANVYFYLVGRDAEGLREWARGYASVHAQASEEGNWKISQFVLESLESLVSTIELFSEVGGPAGVAAFFPVYGSSQNRGFVWHGAAAADVDLDGLMDIFATGIFENYLYLNEGNGRFRDASAQTQTKILPKATTPLFLDYDNDGDQDLFLSSPQNQMLLENRLIPEGKLEFFDVSLQSGIGLVPAIGFSAIAGDVNGDGRPDIYVSSYNRYGQVMPNSWHRATNGTPNLLFINKGNGEFVESAKEWGVDDGRWSYAAGFVDIDEDGDMDIYVANDFGENGLYLNHGDRFVDVAVSWGVLDPGNGMGVSFGDYDNDGDQDLHVTNMSSTAGNRILGRLFPSVSRETGVLVKLASGNSLYENLGNGQFKDVTSAVGGFSSGWAWGGGFIDFDNDGWEDIYTPNGFISGKSMKDT